MLRKTHMVIGIASAMMFTKPATIPDLILAGGGGVLGALISDIDVGTSDSHREADKITMISVVVVAGVFVLDCFFHTGIINRLLQNSGYGRILMGTLLFIGICAFGKEQPHRSFMHSFLALGLLCFAIGLIWEKMVIYFAVGFISHLALDILNKKRVRLFYPVKGGVSLGLFRADGVANNVLFKLGSVVVAVELIAFVMQLFR